MHITPLTRSLFAPLVFSALIFSSVTTQAQTTKPAASKPTPASEKPFLEPGARPKSAIAYWSTAKFKQKDSIVTAVDVIGGNNFTALSELKAYPGAGFEFSGNQTITPSFATRMAVGSSYAIEVDVQPASSGAEHQTVVYLFGFCELRYRMSRQELSFIVWRLNAATGEVMANGSGSVKLPIVAGKWNRVRAVIEGDTARLTINGTTTETKIEGVWDPTKVVAPMMIGFGGADRPFTGRIDHLLITK